MMVLAGKQIAPYEISDSQNNLAGQASGTAVQLCMCTRIGPIHNELGDRKETTAIEGCPLGSICDLCCKELGYTEGSGPIDLSSIKI